MYLITYGFFICKCSELFSKNHTFLEGGFNLTPLGSFKHSLFLEYRTPINTPEADIFSFLLKGKRIKTFQA